MAREPAVIGDNFFDARLIHVPRQRVELRGCQCRKEDIFLINDALNTFSLRFYG